jgi:hypothetical protein
LQDLSYELQAYGGSNACTQSRTRMLEMEHIHVYACTSVTNVMANDHQYATEIARLHKVAAESRLKAVESQLALAFTLCAIAETEIRYSRPDEAIKVLNKVRHQTETISFHIGEPNHLPSTAISRLREQVSQLKKRTEEIESRLR